MQMNDGTTSQSDTMETEEDVPNPAQCSDAAAACVVSVKGLKENWQKWSNEHREYQKHNPFSHDTRPGAAAPQGDYGRPLQGDYGRPLQGDYGRPLQGSMTEQRGKDAHTHIGREVEELCEAIRNVGRPGDKDGRVITVEFGKLFDHYVTISNKLVGVLLRARKQGLVDFEGEMLWQGKDDQALITLLQGSEN